MLSDVKALNTIAVSADPVAIDAWAHTLFGMTKEDFPRIHPPGGWVWARDLRRSLRFAN